MQLVIYVKIFFILIGVICIFGSVESQPKERECLTFTNLNHECDNLKNCTKKTTQCSEGEYCFAMATLHTIKEKMIPSYGGCYSEDYCQVGPIGSTKCELANQSKNFYMCCCTGDMCNGDITFNKRPISEITPDSVTTTTTTTTTTITESPTDSVTKKINYDKQDKESGKKLLIYILPVAFGFFLVIIFAAWFIRRKRKLRNTTSNTIQFSENERLLPHTEFQEVISYGNFGCVRKAIYDGQLVAIKCLNAQGSGVWDSEQKIHSMCGIEHENLVKFIAAEKRFENNRIQHWIITEYCMEGSLVDFLNSHVLSFESLMNASLSIAKGLAFLHCKVTSAELMKPSIAHCDLKSRNILVKDTTATCCISDFGLATVLHNDSENKAQRMQVGTPRYMAPELLEGVISNQEDSILAVDVYALSLVLWELLSRCNAFGEAPDGYVPPFHDFVGPTPSVEDMRLCVVENRQRPILKSSWKDQPLLREYCKNIEESWDEDSDARLTSECVHERLQSLLKTYQEEYSQSENTSEHTSDEHSSETLSKALCHTSLQLLAKESSSEHQPIAVELTV